jgi:hypothetical protein
MALAGRQMLVALGFLLLHSGLVAVVLAGGAFLSSFWKVEPMVGLFSSREGCF